MQTYASIIIPTYNGSRRIGECIEALLAQKTSTPYEIIVVDDGSTDTTPAVVGQFSARPPQGSLTALRVITQPNAGPGAARNNGVRQAHGQIVLFVDDDCVPQPDWLDRMLAPFADPQVAACKGAYLTRQRELAARFVQIEYEEKYDCLRRHQYIDFIDTYSAAFRRDVFLQFGGYDLRFVTASVEDQEFSFRLAKAGHKMVFVPKARVWHTHVRTPRQYLRKKFKNGYWKVLVVMKDPSKLQGDSHTPTTQKVQVGLAGMFLPSFAGLAAVPLVGEAGWIIGLATPAVVAAAFALTSIPLVLRCLRRDPAVGLAAPFFIACRAAALAAGLAWGFLCRRRWAKAQDAPA